METTEYKNTDNNIENIETMQTDKIISAIDIGTTKIVAVIGSVSDKGKVKILGMGKTVSKGVRRGAVINIDDASSAIKEAVEQAEQQSKLKFKDVYVGIAGQHIKSMKNRHSKYIQSPDNEIKQSDIDELLADMYNIALEVGEKVIHVIPQSYTVDNERGEKKPIGMFGKRLEANYHIVVGDISQAKHIYKSIERAGLNIIDVMLEPLASSEAVLTEDEKEIGVAMVDIGGGTTDIAIYYDGILRHTSVIPFGGDAVTKDIKEACSILHRQAEKIKIQFGTALGEAVEDDQVSVPGISGREPKIFSLKFLSQVIEARMTETIESINYEIENSGYAEKLGAGIIITGGGALLKYLRQLMSYKTSQDVSIGYPNKCLSVEEIKMNLPIYSTSIGLLLTGYRHFIENETKLSKDISEKKSDEEIDEINEDNEYNENKSENLMNFLKDKFHSLFDDKGAKM